MKFCLTTSDPRFPVDLLSSHAGVKRHNQTVFLSFSCRSFFFSFWPQGWATTFTCSGRPWVCPSSCGSCVHPRSLSAERRGWTGCCGQASPCSGTASGGGSFHPSLHVSAAAQSGPGSPLRSPAEGEAHLMQVCTYR